MNTADQEYFKLIDLVLSKGRVKHNRTGIDTIGVFGAQARFNLQDGFPLLTTKKVFFRGIAHELLWFLSGSTNIKYLVDNDVHIWDEWAYKKYIDWWHKTDFLEKRSPLNPNPQPWTQEEFISLIKGDSIFQIDGKATHETFWKKFGELGEGTYGGMWRKFPAWTEGDGETYMKGNGYFGMTDNKLDGTAIDLLYVDQIQKVIQTLKTNPDSRRLVISAWHPYWVDHCALPPCHCLFQFHTEELTMQERWDLIDQYNWSKEHGCHKALFKPKDMKHPESFMSACDSIGVPRRRLNCQLYQRSCDLFLGVPFNIASYSLLTHLLASVSNMVVGEFVHTYGDLHIYTNHLEQIKLQRSREPMKLPTLWVNPEVKDIFKFKITDFKIEGYESHPAIKGEVAV